MAVLSGADATVGAGRRTRARRCAFARVGVSDEARRLRREQLDHVRSAYRAVVAGAEADIRDRRELTLDLVGVRVEAVLSDVIVRQTVTRIELQQIDEVVLHDRDL